VLGAVDGGVEGVEAPGVLGVLGAEGVAPGVEGVAGGVEAVVVSAATVAGFATLVLPSWFTAALRTPACAWGCGLKIWADGVVVLNHVSGSHQTGGGLAGVVLVAGAAGVVAGAPGTDDGLPLGPGAGGVDPLGWAPEGCDGPGVAGAGADPLGCGAAGCWTAEPGSADVAPGAGVAPVCNGIADGTVPAGQAPVVAGAAWATAGRITPPAMSTAGSPVAARSRARMAGDAGGASVLAVAVKASSPQGCVLGRGQRRDDVLRRHGRGGGCGYGV
jgi:hypothetical protein